MQMKEEWRVQRALEFYNQGVQTQKNGLHKRATEEYEKALECEPPDDFKMAIYQNLAIAIWLGNGFDRRSGADISDQEYQLVKRVLALYEQIIMIYEKGVRKDRWEILSKAYDQAINNLKAFHRYGIFKCNPDGSLVDRDCAYSLPEWLWLTRLDVGDGSIIERKDAMSQKGRQEFTTPSLPSIETKESEEKKDRPAAKRLCVNPDCGKEIADAARFCGYCGTRQASQPKGDETETTSGSEPAETDGIPFIKDVASGLQEKEQVLKTDNNEIPKAEEERTEKSVQTIFYADDFEVLRQFEPVILPTKEEITFENLLSRFQEFVQKKNYPLAIEKKEQRWRAEGGRGKQRIVIQSTLDTKWQRILFPIAVEQMGNDTTLKLSVLRKNEMAEFYYSMCDQIALVSSSGFEVDYQINWRDEKKYGPHITRTIALFAELWEAAVSQLETPGHERYYRKRLEQLNHKNQISNDINKIQTELAKAEQYTSQVNEEIRAVQEDLSKLEKKPGYGIGCLTYMAAVAVFSVVAAVTRSEGVGVAGSLIGLLVAGGIIGQRFFSRQWKQKVIDDLRKGKLRNAQEQQSNIQSQLSQKNLEPCNIDATINADKRRLILAISEPKYHTFQEAEQNERKWREPSFVDEELEQLVFVVKNVFNQITGQLTGRKEVKDVKLQSTIGLGGMGFDE